jgi:hypothetical protein
LQKVFLFPWFNRWKKKKKKEKKEAPPLHKVRRGQMKGTQPMGLYHGLPCSTQKARKQCPWMDGWMDGNGVSMNEHSKAKINYIKQIKSVF